MLTNILLVVHLIVAVAIVILTLLQQGKGSDMGAAFGGGSSQSLFGARGSSNFLSRATSTLVTVFFVSSLTLAYLYNGQRAASTITTPSVVDAAPAANGDADAVPLAPDSAESIADPAAPDVPAAPAAPTE